MPNSAVKRSPKGPMRNPQGKRKDSGALTRLVTPAPDPPQIKSNVWVPRVKRLTFVLTSTATSINAGDVFAGFFRLTGIRVWVDPGLGNLIVKFNDPVSGHEFQTVSDAGSYSIRSRAGIMYSRSVQNHIMYATADDTELVSVIAPVTGSFICDVHFLQQLS